MPDPKKEDIFEESTYKVTATIKSGLFSTKYKGKLDLLYTKGDTVLHTDANVDVSKGVVEKDYLVPKVPDTEETYVLKIVAKYGKNKEKTRVLTEATVWPKKLKLTIKDTENKAIKEVPFEVEFGTGAKEPGDTDDNGVGNVDLKKSTYEIKIKAPWEVISNKNDAKKREHDIVVRKNMQAKIVKPDLTKPCWSPATEGGDNAAGVRQYVNAPTSGENGCDGDGSIIEFEVACKKLTDGQKNDKIYIKVEFSKLGERTTPVPTLLAPALAIASADGGKTLTGHTMLAADGGTAKFKLQLGYAGGETFKVSVGYSKDDPSDDTQTFVTWRKVTYQLRFPKLMKVRMTEKTRTDGTKYFDLPDAVYNVAKTRLAAVFVEYKNVKSHEFDPPPGSPCLVTRGYLEDSADTTPVYVIDEKLIWLGGGPNFDPVADNRETTITLCDAALDIATKMVNPTVELTAVETNNVIIDTAVSYKYFVKRPFEANTVNLDVAAYEWVAAMDKVADTDKNVKPTVKVEFVTEDREDWDEYEITEPNAGTGSVVINFSGNDPLTTGDKAKLKTFYEACFNKAKEMRQQKNVLTFKVSGPAGVDGHDAQHNAIKSEFNSIRTASAKTLLYHPGLDDDGVPRKGPMTDVTIEHVTARKLKFKLPVRANDTEALKPGDFVGAASATKCPVNVTYSMKGAYTYNGHAGGGSQVLVLRNVIPEAIAATVCHELGHAMGMAVMPLATGAAMPMPPGVSADLSKNVDSGGWYYRNKKDAPHTNGFRNLHQGPHCSNGMPADKKPHQSFSGWSPTGASPACIMWGSGGGEDSRTQYCANCTKILKARDLRDVRKTWAGSAEG
jgi:hypothetical protein